MTPVSGIARVCNKKLPAHLRLGIRREQLKELGIFSRSSGEQARAVAYVWHAGEAATVSRSRLNFQHSAKTEPRLRACRPGSSSVVSPFAELVPLGSSLGIRCRVDGGGKLWAAAGHQS